ncbi:MAG: hypothetical protein AABW52_03120 [Nanoarchaeota archaeon]
MEVKKERQFIYYWYKEFSWSTDPFKKAIPVPIDAFIVGYEEERKKINYSIIENKKLCFIESDEGMGKTSIIRWVKHEISSYQKLNVISLDSSMNYSKLVHTIIDSFLSFKEGLPFKIKKFSGLVSDENLKSIITSLMNNISIDYKKLVDFLNSRIGSKHFVLVMDDFDKTSSENISLIQYLLSSDLKAQFILTSSKRLFDKLSLNEKPIKIILKSMDFDSCVEMIKKRIEGCNGKDTDPFSSNDLKLIYKKSYGSPSLFLDFSREKAIDLALNKIKFTKRAPEHLEELKQHIDEQSKSLGKDKEKEDYQIKIINKPSHDIILEPIQYDKVIVDPVKLKKDKIDVKKVK